MKNEVEAIECYCGSNAELVTEMERIQSYEIDNYFPLNGGRSLTKSAEEHCNKWIYAFNQVPNENRACAFIFGSKTCETTFDGQSPENWYERIRSDNDVINLPELSSGEKAKSVGAVIVKPGCSFLAYDGRNGTGRYKNIHPLYHPWSSRRHKPKFYPLAPEYNPFGTYHYPNAVSCLYDKNLALLVHYDFEQLFMK